eukprot:scaffold197582_cov19-Tisochrysis_lutea.AAC.1
MVLHWLLGATMFATWLHVTECVLSSLCVTEMLARVAACCKNICSNGCMRRDCLLCEASCTCWLAQECMKKEDYGCMELVQKGKPVGQSQHGVHACACACAKSKLAKVSHTLGSASFMPYVLSQPTPGKCEVDGVFTWHGTNPTYVQRWPHLGASTLRMLRFELVRSGVAPLTMCPMSDVQQLPHSEATSLQRCGGGRHHFARTGCHHCQASQEQAPCPDLLKLNAGLGCTCTQAYAPTNPAQPYPLGPNVYPQPLYAVSGKRFLLSLGCAP